MNADILTHTELLAAMAVHRLRGEGYGNSLRAEIEERAGRVFRLGTLYAALDKLEKRGFVTARFGEATAVRGGRRKKHFALTGEGQRAMALTLEQIEKMRADTPAFGEVFS